MFSCGKCAVPEVPPMPPFRCNPDLKVVAMEPPVSIASLVAKAVSERIPSPRPKRRRPTAQVLEELARYNARDPDDDSDFDDSFVSDEIWNRMYKHEDQEYDQHIFNVFRQDKIDTQERKVNVTTAVSVRDCPEKAEEIAMWTRLVEPVLSKAPRRKRRRYDKAKAKRDLELDRILAEAVAEMQAYPQMAQEGMDVWQ